MCVFVCEVVRVSTYVDTVRFTLHQLPYTVGSVPIQTQNMTFTLHAADGALLQCHILSNKCMVYT